jgi:uncharacterized protein (DUF433 family)
MARVATDCTHIELREGVAYITGTATKVRMVVVNHRAFGWDGKELQEQMPHLTLGQVYAALSYYYDHQDEIDADIEAGERMAEELRPQLEDPEARARLLERIAALRGSASNLD